MQLELKIFVIWMQLGLIWIQVGRVKEVSTVKH